MLALKVSYLLSYRLGSWGKSPRVPETGPHLPLTPKLLSALADIMDILCWRAMAHLQNLVRFMIMSNPTFRFRFPPLQNPSKFFGMDLRRGSCVFLID